MITSIKLFKESLSNGLSREEKIELLNDFKEWSGGYNPNEVDWQDGEDSVLTYIEYSIINPKPEAAQFLEDIYDGVEQIENYINESTVNESASELNNYFDEKTRKIGRFDIAYYAEQNRDGRIFLEVVADSKRGYPRDAFLTALSVGKPSLPQGYEYVTGTPVDYSMKEITRETIKADDEMYDDRGYTDSEFSGSVRYEIKKNNE